MEANEMELKMPFGPPPVCPDALKQLEQYLLNIEQLPIYNFEIQHKIWPRKPQLPSLTNFHIAPVTTTLKPDRDPSTGELLKFSEVFVSELTDIHNNNQNILDPNMQESIIDFDNLVLLNTPPGMKRGYNFGSGDSKLGRMSLNKNVVNLTNILQVEDTLGFNINESKEEKTEMKKQSVVSKVVNIDSEEQKEVIPMESSIPVLKISETPKLKVLEQADWAEELDVKPVLDFKIRVPKMAYTWDFTLDSFQQLAIVKLEEDCNVFVAAHTSAGKTVVAEYAIALSLQRCTRAIYTSPIKALSNQKYRDFRNNFEINKKMGEVGLITGDIQLNPKAPCLIMTTEILRSMLYNKSEVVQDLEFVIFDEVHYINDPDRGHVWEEVMMLLQSHVKIVMLSATVPNAIEFANWVGEIKKKKVYLICTQTRPVPLHFYLYTGTNEKTTDNMFLVRKAEGSWNNSEYIKADKSKQVIELEKQSGGGRSRKGAFRGSRGGGYAAGGGYYNSNYHPNKQGPGFEKTMWSSFINHLKKIDKLPVVVFVLSRGRCDDTAEMMRSCLSLVDVPSSDFIRHFFNKNINHLKEEDRKLPQVRKMGELLAKGIGVHHSGILPILKEIVEMLFQQGKVQLLLATETFAMGVNMPTKTVVFESIRKFDGTESRDLLPAEFIQMAGRAGRRGIDETGTVIIMCKNKMPLERDLKTMMFNKPSKLESQFKMTYATILKNLLRTNEATNPVEKLMSSSFKEFSEKSKHHVYKEKLDVIMLEFEQLKEKRETIIREPNMPDVFYTLENFYDDAYQFYFVRKEIQEYHMNHPKVLKELVPGHIILVAQSIFSTRLGMILAVDRNKKNYQVLIMVNKYETVKPCYHNKDLCICNDEIYFRMIDIIRGMERFVPDCKDYRVIKIETQHILELTTLGDSAKYNFDAILNDWRHRQYNSRNFIPGEDTFKALQSLTEKSSYIARNHIISLSKKVEPHTLDYKKKELKMESLKNKLRSYNMRIIPECDNLFFLVYRFKRLLNKIEDYERKITEYSMAEDFKNKLNVLKELKYVDSSNNVELKGRGAIRMTTNEIMVTELIFNNTLSDYEPAEIAALLSCLVFQAKTKIEMMDLEKQLPYSLVTGMYAIKEIHKSLEVLEKKHLGGDDFIREFTDINFGLVQVVYEWACDKVFSEIMKLTDVQEGIIVRCIQQLNEVLRCVKEVAQKVGDCTLEAKMDKASNVIKRDIVFAASLYLQKEN